MRFSPGLFGDYASRGVDAVLRFTSKAGDRLRAASDDAIGKMDALQLEKKLERLYADLGHRSYEALSRKKKLTCNETDIKPIVDEIMAIESELRRKRPSVQENEK